MPNFYPRVTAKASSETKTAAPLDFFQNPLAAWQSFQMPLSGDVTQAINPWSWTFDSATSQLGLVNINLGRSGNPELEQEVLDEVGSYGKQLGCIGDALAVLIKHVKLDELAPPERDAITRLRFQLEEIEKIKAGHRTAKKVSKRA
ncbi:MAG: hypothetical protein H6R13_2652 [Proteobacteria bacterium]|nr:hypothetical protein [Pseudomonadota bacterium]